MKKKKVKIIAGVILAIIDIAICLTVGIVWQQIEECSGWSFFAETIFYSVGCYAVWTDVDSTIDLFYKNKEDIFYGKKH